MIETSVQDPWKAIDTQAIEIKNKAEPIDYSRLLGDSQVLILGEVHSTRAVRHHLAANALTLKNLGISHYGIEAPADKAIERLNDDPTAPLGNVSLGPFSKTDPTYEQAVRAMATAGIQIVAVDIHHTPYTSTRRREKHLTRSVHDIVKDDPDAKAIVLIGALHAYKNEPKTMAARLARKGLGISVGQFHEAREYTFFSQATSDADLEAEEFMLDLRPYHNQQNVMFGPGNADYVIHLPQGSHWKDGGWSDLDERFDLI